MPQPLIGSHAAIVTIRCRLGELARSNRPLVLVGETGTGKSLVAAHIHALSPYRGVPLRWINLITLGDRDQRIELFGAEPPELSSPRRGILEHPTTVLIKHIDHAMVYVQDSFAAALSTGRVTRLRSRDSLPLCGRVIFTLRNDVTALVREGRLADRLSDQLNKYEEIRLPSLNERRGDIGALVRAFQKGKRVKSSWQGEMLQALSRHKWTRNLNELKAYLELISKVPPQAALHCPEKILMHEILLSIEDGREHPLRKMVAVLERHLVARALERTSGSQIAAARLLGVADRTVRRQMSEYRNR